MPRPTIILSNRQYRDILADVWSAVKSANNPPTLFIREGKITRLRQTEYGPKLEFVTPDTMFGIMIESADFFTINARGNQVANKPTTELAKTMVSLPDQSLPPIEGISSTPLFDTSGNMVVTNGYYAPLSTYFYGMEKLVKPTGPRILAQAISAVRLLRDEIFCDFPFAKEGEFAHVLATLLLPFVRKCISGVTPIHLFEANGPGSGKTLMADIITQIATGETLAPIAPSDREEEMRKRITSLLVEGKGIIVLDNLNKELNSGVLASAITGARWADRPLGLTKIVELPNNAVWIVTGNNPRLSLEVARRCVRVRLTPEGNAWERGVEAYRHPHILKWIAEHRSELIEALYCIVRAWYDAGRPKPVGVSLGSFESWVDVIGGIIQYVQIKGFLENCKELYTDSDPVSGEWEEFVEAWWQQSEGRWLSPTEISLIAESKEYLPTALGDGNSQSRRIRLGYALTSRRDSYIGGYRIERRKDGKAKTVLYRVLGPPTQKGIAYE